MEGQTLGSYRVLKKLGEGGMGAVYLAEHPIIGKKAAVKVLLPHFCSNPDIVNRFLNEARACAQLRHPSIIEIFDFGHHSNGAAFIVMEFLEGESLSQRLHAGPLPRNLLIEVVRQVASALALAHQKAIVHRDLKPDNVFLLPDTDVPCGVRAKVLDFGIAKITEEPSPQGSIRKTNTGALMGTPGYMSPEQCRGAGGVDHRTDIYALGCMMFEMASGSPPFNGEGPGDVIAAHLYQEPPSLAAVGIAPELDRVIQRALAKRADDRYQTMAEVIAELERLGAHATGRQAAAPSATRQPIGTAAARTTLNSAASELTRYPVKRRRARATLFWASGVIAAGLIGGVVWLGTRTQPERPTVASNSQAAAAQPSAPAIRSPPRAEVQPAAKRAPERGPPSEHPREVAAASTHPATAQERSVHIKLKIESQPPSATVYRAADGERMGKTPLLQRIEAGPGQAEFVLKLLGYRDQHVSLPLDRDGERRVTLVRSAPSIAREAKPIPESEPTPPSSPAPKANKNEVLNPFDH